MPIVVGNLSLYVRTCTICYEFNSLCSAISARLNEPLRTESVRAVSDSWGSQSRMEHALDCIYSRRSGCPAALAWWEPVVKLYLHNIETFSNAMQLYKCTCLYAYLCVSVCVHICANGCVCMFVYVC